MRRSRDGPADGGDGRSSWCDAEAARVGAGCLTCPLMQELGGYDVAARRHCLRPQRDLLSRLLLPIPEREAAQNATPLGSELGAQPTPL